MVFDHKGRLMKADTCAERILAAVGVELSRVPRLRVDVLDTSSATPLGNSDLPAWLDPEWIEPVMEGSERLGTVVKIQNQAQRSAPPTQGGLPAFKMRRVVEFIEAHLDRPITLARLAAVVDVSKFHFHRQFKRATGSTPHQYIVQKRIERAKALLSDSQLPLVKVAAEAGFADQSHFGSTFRKVTSMTPRGFRNATSI
jgi:AraC family transcriptional regulator